MAIIVICLLIEKKFNLNLKPTIRILTYLLSFVLFCLLSIISNGLIAAEPRKVILKGNVYDFSVDYNSIDKFDILSIQKYLMKNII